MEIHPRSPEVHEIYRKSMPNPWKSTGDPGNLQKRTARAEWKQMEDSGRFPGRSGSKWNPRKTHGDDKIAK